MEFALKSHFSPKEVMLPINEILLYFTQDDYSEAKVEEEKVLMFMRACDINAVKKSRWNLLKKWRRRLLL